MAELEKYLVQVDVDIMQVMVLVGYTSYQLSVNSDGRQVEHTTATILNAVLLFFVINVFNT